jgi:hypothetical protein
MAKLLTNREMELFNVAINFAVKLNNCNPDIGIGPNQETIAEDVASKYHSK